MRAPVGSLLLAAFLLAAPAPGGAQSASPGSKLRGGLAEFVAGVRAPDARIPALVAGYRPGELAYFAVVAGPKQPTQRADLAAAGARVLRDYRSLDLFALASDAATVLRVAALPWVERLSPVEVVVALDHEQEVDQSRGKTADVGAPPWWSLGVTGAGVRIAVLDTGYDPTHPDLDDLDFRHWSSPLGAPKVVDARNFNGGGCEPLGAFDGHGHGTHVAGIATGTGEGMPLAGDDGRYAGIAPGAELAVGKALTDAGAGLNSDLIAAMEWAAMPEEPGPLGCGIDADIVNMSLGSEARPSRLNSGDDIDLVSFALNRLAVRYGTLFVAAAGNSGPYIGSTLEAPGSAAQALSVAASAKDWDVNHDDTLSGDTCAGWRHPRSSSLGDNNCHTGVGDQPPSISSFSSRGPSGDLWLRPDLAAPGYNIVSAQSATGSALLANDLNRNTKGDPLYATATGTSMAAPAAAGSAALVLQAYRLRHGSEPSGGSGVDGLAAPAYALLRAALMNTAGGDMYESRWILTTDAAMRLVCPPTPAPLFPTFCGLGETFTDLLADAFGSFTVYEVRNGAADPYVGPLAEGAGKLNVGRAIAALRDGVVAYSAASGSGAAAGTGPRDLQGSWQVGPIAAGSIRSQRFVLRAAPGIGPVSATFSLAAGNPSDGSQAIPSSWGVRLPGRTSIGRGKSSVVKLTVAVPSNASPGTYTGTILARVSNGQVLRIPVLASVALHDPNRADGNAPGPQARVASGRDVFAKDDTSWPSAAGTAGTGANADWLVYPVELAEGLDRARFFVHDAATGDETYDLYLYDSQLDLVASTHPFLAGGVTDPVANDARGPSTQIEPQTLTVESPAAGRHYVAVSRAKVGGTSVGDFGSFVLTLDEVRAGAWSGGGCADEDDELVVAGPVLAAPGGAAEYELAYTNHGGGDDEACELVDVLDADTSFGSASSGGTYNPVDHAVTWRLGTVPAGATVRVRVNTTVSPFVAPGAVLLNGGSVLGPSPLAAFAETLVVS
jgi:subtilisin family serine protease